MDKLAALITLMLVFLLACTEDGQSPDAFKEYEGPIMEASDVELFYSDSAIVRIRLTAERQLEFLSGNREFPEGIFIEFFDKQSVKSSSIKADHGFFDKRENKYTATGNVIVRNFTSGEKLETEVLHWEPNKNEIYTDRYVEITSGDEVLMGEGLTSDEEFVNYRILRPKGAFSLSEQNQN
ncbi:MAG: LPS export ABC transporter periplasmic protein LptC [Cyclobacteriaceae bacterium]